MANILARRFDRFASAYFARPLKRYLFADKKARIPILMYHSISESHEERIHPYYGINTSPRLFAEHMKYLSENKYAVIALKQAVQFLASGNGAPERCAVITFDDGYRNFYTQAFPILDRYGFTATVFLPTHFIDNNRQKFNDQDCLNWEEVRELSKTGVIFGSHSVTHPQLRFLKRADIECEIKESKETIEDEIGEAIQTFSYPYAFPQQDPRFKQILKEILDKHGYQTGVTTIIGRASSKDVPLFLRRIPINGRDDSLLYRAKLEGAYDWMRIPQRLKKRINHAFMYGRTRQAFSGLADCLL
jgi:peptidoglycan/xylan/chitin deacetylase (PgdA/CDA1 family)